MTDRGGGAPGRCWTVRSTARVALSVPAAPRAATPPTTPPRCRGDAPHSPPPRAFEEQGLRRLIHRPGSEVSRKRGLGAQALEGMLDPPGAQSVDGASREALGGLGVDEKLTGTASRASARGPRTGRSASGRGWRTGARRR